jgi:hypothetical protein
MASLPCAVRFRNQHGVVKSCSCPLNSKLEVVQHIRGSESQIDLVACLR